mgnify:CR=1 FL=1
MTPLPAFLVLRAFLLVHNATMRYLRIAEDMSHTLHVRAMPWGALLVTVFPRVVPLRAAHVPLAIRLPLGLAPASRCKSHSHVHY